MEDDLHKGHRKRLRAKYLSDGIDRFEDHEILELLLFYALPQRDTNPLAHKLLNDFGSISAVLDAPISYMKKQGLSENTITLLKLIPDLARVYINDKNNNKSKVVDMSKTCQYFKDKFIGRTEEVLHLLLLDGKYKEVFSGVISKGSINSTDVPVRTIIELAILYKAKYAIIAHNHPSGLALPSKDDLQTTMDIQKALQLINVILCDHVIVSGDEQISLRDSLYSDILHSFDFDD